MIEVLRPGLLDMVMDLGRPGFRAQGVPEGGAADSGALALANRLVGNADAAAGLEILLRGPTLRFPKGGTAALTGADMDARLNGTPVPVGRTFEIPPDGELGLGIAVNGLRGYLAAAGGIEAPVVLGSRATFLPGKFGGWQGRALKMGDMLPLAGSEFPRKGGVISQAYGDDALRVLPGPQLSGFVDGALKGLTKDKFSVSSDASRLGVRLSGPALKYADGELASQAVLPGAIQVPPDGRLIILGWDGPVTGGYPVIAGVIAADLHRLAQLRPGDTLEFRFVSREEAQEAWVEQRNVLNEAIEWDA
jgi:biotin-dependent carboxylase-like uncharacterized protein